MHMKNVSYTRIIPWYSSKAIKNRIFFPIAMSICRHGYLKHDDDVCKKIPSSLDFELPGKYPSTPPTHTKKKPKQHKNRERKS